MVRLITYNVRNSIGMDRVTDYRRTADVIGTLHPTTAAIQELDSITKRSRGQDALRQLAALTGMQYRFNRSIVFDGGSYGVGVLYADNLVSVSTLPLPGREEARSALFVELPAYVFCSTHLSLTEEDRLASIDLITERAKRYSKPVFLAGDLNDTPSSPTIRALAAGWTILSDTTQYTFPSINPNVCIDYIAVLGKPPVRVLRAGVIADSITSDHRPVYVDVEMR